ncbi:MAG: hypothetical protein ACI8RD_001119 [Bacillariaceae sp.]|jgi:hypothetical protein
MTVDRVRYAFADWRTQNLQQQQRLKNKYIMATIKKIELIKQPRMSF